VTTGLIVEELAYGDFNISAVTLVMSLCGAIIARNASPQVAAEWLPRIPRAEAILALSITEPKCGSDASAIELKARREGHFYVLEGEKTSTTYCGCADAFVVFARTGRIEDGREGRDRLPRAGGHAGYSDDTLEGSRQPHGRARLGVLRQRQSPFRSPAR